MPSWSLFQAGSSPAWILVCAAFQSMVKGFLGGSPAFLQQIQVHECQFKFLPIRHPVFCYGPISLWHLFICLLKKTQTNRFQGMFPSPAVTFLGSEIPLQCCVRKVESSVVIGAIYFLPMKEEGILEWFCSAEAQRSLWIM